MHAHDTQFMHVCIYAHTWFMHVCIYAHTCIHTHIYADKHKYTRILTRSSVHMQHTNIGSMWSMTCTPRTSDRPKKHQKLHLTSVYRNVIYFEICYVFRYCVCIFTYTYHIAGHVDSHITGLGVEVKYRREQAQMGMFKKLFTRTKSHGEPPFS